MIMTKEKCSIRLVRLSEEHTVAFKEEMQEAFQHGFMAYYKDDNQWQVENAYVLPPYLS